MAVRGLVALSTVARVAGPATCRHASPRLGESQLRDKELLLTFLSGLLHLYSVV